MKDFQNGCAVITGGGGLLGRAMALAFAKRGINVVVSDSDVVRADSAARGVRELGAKAEAIITDVSDRDAMDRLASAAYTRFGHVGILCLNAGAAIHKPIEELTGKDWDSVLGVQFGGVLNGLLSFLKPMIADSGRRHIVITSSMSGVGRADWRLPNAPYVTAKFATVGLGEVLAPGIARYGIGVSLLCPGMTVADPTAALEATWPMKSPAWYRNNILDADQVAQEVIHGIQERRLYIFPHRAGRQEVVGRHARLMEGFDQAERTSPALNGACPIDDDFS
jgi:NAD(P)-dependent dehydrogenase (short-subunit alcohol dehydrogenase family)